MTHNEDDINEDDTKLDMSAIVTAPAWDRVASGYAEVIAPHFGLYAADAIRLAQIAAGDEVLDVATGPGTLALQAARITSVHALDFSENMIAELRKRAESEGLTNLVARQGDGQDLPYDDGSFDAAFSMFGLFMFPDRARGFSELARVLRQDGRAVVGTWQPLDSIPAFAIIDSELAKEVADPIDGGQPLADRAELEREMSAAGFSVEIHEAVHVLHTPSLQVLWAHLQRSHVTLGMAAKQLPGQRCKDLFARIHDRLEKELGSGAQELEMRAWLGLGRR